MFRGLRAFNKEFEDFAHKVPRGAHAAGKRVARQMFNEIVDITPVDTGFASSRWAYTVNKRPTSSPVKHPSPGKGSWAGANTPAFRNFKFGNNLYIYNDASYIVELEKGRSDQAPRNFFNNAVVRARRRLQAEYNRLRWRNDDLK